MMTVDRKAFDEMEFTETVYGVNKLKKFNIAEVEKLILSLKMGFLKTSEELKTNVQNKQTSSNNSSYFTLF